MQDRLNDFLTSLRDLAKAHEKLAKAVPDPRTAEQAADHTLERTLSLLDDPSVAVPLAELLPAARQKLIGAPEEFDAELAAQRSKMVRIETHIMRRSGADLRDIEQLYILYQHSRSNRHQFPNSVDAIKACLVEAHKLAKQQLEASRELGRKDKKRRKRKVGQGLASAIFGTAAIVADTQLPLLFAFSYGLGGGALHQALRDIVGEPPDEDTGA